MSTITVNGKPLEKHLADIAKAEIEQVRESENRFKLRRSAITKRDGNTSGERTARATTIYRSDQDSQFVVIEGTVFPFAEKAPFVGADESFLGAFETNKSQTKMICHICGEWFEDVGRHAYHAHDTNWKDYRIKYGLSATTPLLNPAARKEKALRAAKQCRLNPDWSRGGLAAAHKALEKCADRGWLKRSVETENLRLNCAAQLTKRILAMAVELGRTPTTIDLRRGDKHGKIFGPTIRFAFNASWSTVAKNLGLHVSKGGGARAVWKAGSVETRRHMEKLRQARFAKLGQALPTP